ncbi:MAG: hypothetical protein Q4G16_09350, partial [Cruoricaptor ignavus]|nr:hypothetical protein [Cruoricaptor ignavus]
MMKNLFAILLFIASIIFIKAEEVHPYHVGSVEFNYNNKTKTFEISGKFFTDDLENAINEKFGTSVFFHDEKSKSKMNTLLQNYLADYIKLKVNNTFVKINYIGFEEDREAVNLYLESEPITNPHKVEVAVSVLYNLFDDQMNIIHIIVSGKRQSHKLRFPDRYLYKNF